MHPSNAADPALPDKSAPLPATVKLLSWASFLNDVASEMIYTQIPRFILEVLGGSKVHLGFMEGAAEAISSLVKLWSGARTDQTGRRKGLVVVGYTIAVATRLNPPHVLLLNPIGGELRHMLTVFQLGELLASRRR